MNYNNTAKLLKFGVVALILITAFGFTASATTQSPEARLSITSSDGFYTLDASESSDPDGEIITYSYDIDNDGYFDTSSSSSSFSTSFNEVPDNARVKVEDEDGHTDIAAATYTDASGYCGVYSGFLTLTERNIKEGQTTEAFVNIYNEGDDQDVRVTFYQDGRRIEQVQKTVSDHKTRFSLDVAPTETARISHVADTVGEPCGNNQISSDSQVVRVSTVDQKGSLELNVEDQNGDPVENARITAGSSVTYTDSSGRATMTLEEGHYNVEISRNNFFTKKINAEITAGERETRTVELLNENAEGSLKVKTVDRNGDELEDVTVEARNSEAFSKTTGSNGETIFQLKPDSYKVSASKSGYRTETRNIDIEAGGDREMIIEMSEISRSDGDGFINVNVEDNLGDPIDDARVRVQNGDILIESTDSTGNAQFEVDPDRYDIDVSATGYETDNKNVRVESGEFRTVNFRLESTDTSENEARLEVQVEDEDGDELRNARVEVENGEREVRYTDSAGEAVFFLEPDNYDIEVSKSGYFDEDGTVSLDEGDDETVQIGLEQRDSDRENGADTVTIQDVSVSDSTVCRGDTVYVYADIRNDDFSDRTVTFGARGLGSTVAKSVTIDGGSTEQKKLRIDNVQGSGSETVEVAVTGQGQTDEVTTNVNVESCGSSQQPSITASSVSINVEPKQVQAGDSVKVSGYVDGTRGSQQVSISINGRKVSDVATEPDGFYSAYVTPQSVGVQEVRATAGERSGSTQITVRPNVYVGSVSTKEKVFESQKFEVCADVQSQVDPSVALIRNGERIDSKNEEGTVCFNTEAPGEAGEYEYEVFASAWGVKDSRNREVEVLEVGSEVENFPDKLAMVRSGDGIARVTLYNTGEDLRTYDVSVNGIPDDWFATTEKEVKLTKGEKENVYFYVTPEAEGNFVADIQVDRDGTKVFQESISINSGGTTESTRKSWIERVASLFANY